MVRGVRLREAAFKRRHVAAVQMPRSLLRGSLLFSAVIAVVLPGLLAAEFAPDETAPSRLQPPLAPVDGSVLAVNPPSLVWKDDSRAASYIVEFSTSRDFSSGVIRVAGIPYAFYNHNTALASGNWHWRYSIVTADGKISQPSSVKTFVVAADTPSLPLPGAKALLAALPAHPRIFATPATLREFRARQRRDRKSVV